MPKDLEPSSCIQTVPIFKNLSPNEINEIVMISGDMKLNKGEFIYRAGDNIHSLYVVHQGRIKITRYTEDGKEQVIRILSSGDFLGELALFNNATVTTNAEALEPAIVCLVDNQKLKQLMTQSPTLSIKMLGELSNRLDKAEALIEQSNLYSAEAKVARLLLDLEKDNLVIFRTTKVNIASNLGISPETLSRKLKLFEENKLIKVNNHKSLRILDKLNLEMVINTNKI